MRDQSQKKIWEKSRRIGASWCEAAASVLAAVEGRNTVYLSYNLDMTATFIGDCAQWAKAFNLELSARGVREIVGKDGVLGFRIRFTNGRSIQALSSRPTNIRSKQARVVIDEAAFCDNLGELLKAAKALLMWGGQLVVLSTHNGEDNPYNELVQAVKEGKPDGKDWSLHRTTIHDAVADGLFRRITQVVGDFGAWSLGSQQRWIDQVFLDHGADADEELLCVPYSARAGKVFDVTKFGEVLEPPPGGITVRFWDLAATEKDLRTTSTKKDPCYTAGVKMRFVAGRIYVLDCIAVQKSAGAVDDLIRATAESDGRQTLVRWELEGGSAGKRDAAHITKLLHGFDAQGVRPQGDKVRRAKPFASQLNAGNAYLLAGSWTADYKKWLRQFPDGKVKDPIDATSGAYAVLCGGSRDSGNTGGSFVGW